MKKILIILMAVLCFLPFTGCAAETEETKSNSAGYDHITPELPDLAFSGSSEDEYSEYRTQLRELTEESRAVNDRLDRFYAISMQELLSSETESRVYSPLNLFFALSVLAETASGETREQILSLLDVNDMEELRELVNKVWKGNNVDSTIVQCKLANSMWLRNDISYNTELLNLLAEKYYADTFSGVMGSEELNKALQDWTNASTGNQLSDYIKDLKTSRDTVMGIVSAIYYKASWKEPFSETATDRQIFHGAQEDKECDMMHLQSDTTLYTGKNFTAIALPIQDSGFMYFVLPNENVSFSDVFDQSQLLDLISGSYDFPNSKLLTVNISVPKFKTDSYIDLIEPLKKLGMIDAFDVSSADFSSITDDIVFPIYLTKAEHAAAVEIDEDGLTGAAYTYFGVEAAGDVGPTEEVDFTVDKPFIYIITAEDNSILFAGTITDLE